MTTIARDQLKAFVERIERVEEEIATSRADLKEIYAEAKGNGYDVTALRTIVKMRKQDVDERREQEAVLEVYMHALGMLSDTPLGQAALDRVAKEQKTAREKKDDITVTVEFPGSGLSPVETTSAGLKRAAEFAKTPAGRRKIREIARNAEAQDRAESLVNPRHLPSEKEVSKVADRAEQSARNPGNSDGAPPPQSPPPGSAPPVAPAPRSALGHHDDNGIPTFLKRGHPDCVVVTR